MPGLRGEDGLDGLPGLQGEKGNAGLPGYGVQGPPGKLLNYFTLKFKMPCPFYL